MKLTRTTAVLLTAVITCVAGAGSPGTIAPVTTRAGTAALGDLSNAEKGAFGEHHVDDFWRAAGRKPLLDRWHHPNETGPDLIYRRPDGVLEIHEVKAYSDWATGDALLTKVEGRDMRQLSDEWIRAWIRRERASTTATPAELAVVDAVEEALNNGSLVRIYDEVNLSGGRWRVSDATPRGGRDVVLTERAGPMNVKHIERKLAASRAKLKKPIAPPEATVSLYLPESSGGRWEPRTPMPRRLPPPVYDPSKLLRYEVPPSKAMPTIGESVGKALPMLETAAAVAAIPIGGILVAEGCAELSRGDTVAGLAHLFEGGLSTGGGVAILAGATTAGAGLFGGVMVFDGAYDMYGGLRDNDSRSLTVGTFKTCCGIAVVTGACTGNPVLLVGGTVGYVGVVVGDAVWTATRTHHPNFGTSDIDFISPAERSSLDWGLVAAR
jgi:hypothetical protein